MLSQYANLFIYFPHSHLDGQVTKMSIFKSVVSDSGNEERVFQDPAVSYEPQAGSLDDEVLAF